MESPDSEAMPGRVPGVDGDEEEGVRGIVHGAGWGGIGDDDIAADIEQLRQNREASARYACQKSPVKEPYNTRPVKEPYDT